MHWSDGDWDGFHYRVETAVTGNQSRTPRGLSAALTLQQRPERTKNVLIDTRTLGVDDAPHPVSHSWHRKDSK